MPVCGEHADRAPASLEICQPVARLGQSFPREIMFDAVKVDLSAAANRAAHAKAGGVVVQDADDGDEGREGGGATSGAHSSLQRRQMLEKQSHLVRKVNVQRMMAHAGVGTLWQIAGAFLVVILFSFALTSGKASGGRRGWDNAASLPYNQLDDGEIGAAWTTQRLCRHFGAPTPSRVRFLFGVDSPKMLQSSMKAWRRVDVIQVNVGFRLHEDMPPAEAHGWRHRAKGAFDKVTGRSTVGSPAIVADASPYTARTSTFTLYDFLNEFFQQVLDSHQPVGREQGLMVTFVDPRAIEPGLRLIQLATRLGRLPGPLIVDGEILPGPGGFLAQLGSVFVEPPKHDETHAHEERDHHLYVPPVPGDVNADALASRRERTFDFDPRFDFVDKIKKFAPGCILSLRWSAHGGCVDGAVASRAREAYSEWYKGEPFDWDWAEAEQAVSARSESAAAAAHMFAFAGNVAKAVAGAIPTSSGRRMVLEHAGDEAHEGDEAEKNGNEEDDSDSDSESDPAPAPPFAPPATRSTEVNAFAFDANTAALRNEAEGFAGLMPVYDESMMDDAYWLLRNATWHGDATFGFQTCVLAGPDPDGDASDAYPYKKLLQQKLGWTAMLLGDADDDALAFARGDLGKETGDATHGTNRGAPEAATTFVGDVRRVAPAGEGDASSRRTPPLRPTQVLTPTRLGERLAAAEGDQGGEDGEL